MGDRKRRRRRGKRTEAGGEDAVAEAPVAADSSPMVERPIEEEPPIAEVEAPAEPQPKRRKSRAKKKDDTAETVESLPNPLRRSGARRKPRRKPSPPSLRESHAPRKRRTKPVRGRVCPVPTADNDEADASGDGPRRGWWQRTFG